MCHLDIARAAMDRQLQADSDEKQKAKLRGDHEPNPKAVHTHLRVFALRDLWELRERRTH